MMNADARERPIIMSAESVLRMANGPSPAEEAQFLRGIDVVRRVRVTSPSGVVTYLELTGLGLEIMTELETSPDVQRGWRVEEVEWGQGDGA
jgi:hypothetical protein